MKFSFTTIILLAFFAYVLNSVYVIYQLFNVPSCKGNSRKCLPPHRLIDENLEVSRARAIVYNDTESLSFLSFLSSYYPPPSYMEILVSVKKKVIVQCRFYKLDKDITMYCARDD